MKYNKQRLCNIIRRYYPSTFGIRRLLQRIKVKRLSRHQLSPGLIELCENSPDKIRSVIEPFLKEHKGSLSPIIREMEDILANSPLYKDREDKDILRDDILFCRLAYGFLPSEYVVFELEGKTPAQRREFVSDLDMNIFGYSVNDISVLQTILDKGDSYNRFKNYFKRDAVVIERKNDYHAFCDFIKKHPVFVKKQTISSMGKGVELVDINQVHDLENFFTDLIHTGKYLLEERVTQDAEMAVFNDSSVNTVRCFTLKVKDKIIVPWAFMRTGMNGSFVDNGGSGGLVIGVNPQTGVVSTPGYNEYNDAFIEHPNSKVKFEGYQIPHWDELVSLCSEAAMGVNKMGYLSWDLALVNGEWVVIEVNEIGQFIGPQMTTKKGIKKELDGYWKQMKSYI